MIDEIQLWSNILSSLVNLKVSIDGWSQLGVILRLLLYYLQYMDLLQPICIGVILSEILSLELSRPWILCQSVAWGKTCDEICPWVCIQCDDIWATFHNSTLWYCSHELHNSMTHQTLAHCYYSRPHEMLINNSNLLISLIAL